MTTLFTLEDLKNVELRCPSEKGYDAPIMKDSYGNSMYAYVTLVMLGDVYVSAAIVLAYTLKKLHTQADLVVLVTPDVSQEGKELMRQYYDKVVEIDFVEVTNWRVKKQPNRKYLNYVFTKFHCFNLTEYKKILLIDADAMVLKHPDHLFSLATPAGVYLEDKNLFITYDKKGNYILPDNNKIQWYNDYCDCCEHGKLIPKEITDKILKNRNNSGIGGGLMLLEPKEGELDKIVEDVKRGQSKYLINTFFVWPEQQYLSIRYSGKWHSINPVFFGLQGYPHWKVLFGLQYAGDKPFVLNSKFPLSERMKYPDFSLWHHFLAEMIDSEPILKNHSSLKDAVTMNNYFRTDGKLSRGNNTSLREKYHDKDLLAIQQNLNIDINRINADGVKYYHTDFAKAYHNKNDSILFDVKINDYGGLLNNLSTMCDKMDTTYFFNLKKKFDALNNTNVRIDKIDNLSQIEKDTIALHYTMCRKNMFVLTLWPKSVPHTEKIVDFLKLSGDVVYVKYVTADYNTIRNCAFFLYNDYTIKERNAFVDKKLSYTEVNKDTQNTIGIILFDNVHDKKISGQGAKYKRELRDKIGTFIESKEKIWGNDLVHINDFFEEAVEYSQMYFNKNSMEIMKHQNIDRMMNTTYTIFANRFQTLRKWCYLNLTAQQRSRFCGMGGMTWYILGVRPSTDIDGFFVNTHHESEEERKFTELVNKYFVEESTKFEFADMGLEDSSHWKPTWSKKNVELLKALDVNSFDEITMNPEHHFYYHGVKMYKMEYEIVRKFMRIRGQDIADITMLYLNFKNMVGSNIQLDKNKKIIYPKYAGELWDNDKTYNKALGLIKKRYMPKDSFMVTINTIRNMFSRK